MRIQELEQLVGADRATIRFYEKEGLLTPARSENGYRDYSREDAEELKRIILLRELGVPLETIRQLQQGSADFREVMARQCVILKSRASRLEYAGAVCRQLASDNVSYHQLDTAHYRQLLFPASQTNQPPQAAFQEPIKKESHPWRRLIARYLDHSFLNTVVLFLVVVVLRWRPVESMLQDVLSYGSWLLLLPVEAAFIHCLGTTPGKWLMGIRVEYDRGGKMPFFSALSRAWGAFRGMGYAIPFWELWCLYRSFKQHTETIDMDWDDECEVTYTRFHLKRGGLLALALVLDILLTLVSTFDAQLPRYRGEDLTVAEFASNYNMYDAILNNSSGLHMRADGTFESDGSSAYYSVNGQNVPYDPYSDLEFVTEDGKIQSINYSHTWYDYQVFSSYTFTPETEIPKDAPSRWIGNPLLIAMVTAAASQPGMELSELSEFTKQLEDQLNKSASEGVAWEFDDLNFSWYLNIHQYDESDDDLMQLHQITFDLVIDFE